jgi:hypothetical protein
MVPHVGGVVATGSSTVLIEGLPAARMGDTIVESGSPNTVVGGCPTVIIDGGATAATTAETATDRPPWARSLFRRLWLYRDRYNESVEGADLGFAGGRLRNEVVDLHVTAEGADAVFSFVTDDDVRIDELRPGARTDATLRMDATRDTVDEVLDADAPARAFRTAVVEGDVTVRGVGVASEVEWTAIDLLVDVADFFGLV